MARIRERGTTTNRAIGEGSKKNNPLYKKTTSSTGSGRIVYVLTDEARRAAEHDDLGEARGDFDAKDEVLNQELAEELYDRILDGTYGDGEVLTLEVFDNNDIYLKAKQFSDDINARLDEMRSRGATPNEFLAVADEVLSNPDYASLWATQKEAFNKAAELREEVGELNDILDKAAGGESLPEGYDPDRIYEATQEGRDAECMGVICQKNGRTYAYVAARALGLAYQGEEVPELDHDKPVGDAIPMGYFESGSPEWLEMRSHGLGASDEAKLATNMWYASSREELMAEKIAGISQADLDRSSNNAFTGEAFRSPITAGFALENVAGMVYAHKHPDEDVMLAKSTYRNGDSPNQINLDFVSGPKGGEIDTIVEIKTSQGSNGESYGWKDVDDPHNRGLGIQDNYAAQLRCMLRETGLKKAKVCVLEGGGMGFREYTMTIDEADHAANPKESVISAIEKQTKQRDRFVAELNKARDHYANTGELPQKKKGSSRIYKGIPASGIMSGSKAAGYTQTSTMNSIVALGSALHNETPEQFKRRLEESSGLSRDAWNGKMNTKKNVPLAAALNSEIDSIPTLLNGKKAVIVDLETNAMRATDGDVLQIGMVESTFGNSPDKDTHTPLDDRLFPLSPLSFKARYVGRQDIHGIKPGDLPRHNATSSPVFGRNADYHKQMVDTMSKADMVIAHNGTRMESKWLRGHVKGFAKAESQGKIRMVDSLTISQLGNGTASDGWNNSLRDFAESNGVAYEGAHNALNDSMMTGRALSGYRANSLRNGRHRTPKGS